MAGLCPLGGDNSQVSNFTLGSVMGYLDSNGVEWGYSESAGGNIDGSGKYFLYPLDAIKP